MNKVGGITVWGMLPPPKKFKFWGSEMPFPALSTGHFNKYERKSKWLEYILPISNVVAKVQCLRKKGKTVTPLRKLQAKGKIACMTAVLEIIASLWRENPSRDLKTELFVRTV